jgi:hypothetical protein
MKIETDDWLPLAEAMILLKMSVRAARRLAADMGLVHEFFGVKCIRREHVELLNAHKRQRGNQDWIASGALAGVAATKSVESRLARVAKRGMTTAEKRRNAFLSSGKARAGAKLDDAT